MAADVIVDVCVLKSEKAKRKKLGALYLPRSRIPVGSCLEVWTGPKMSLCHVKFSVLMEVALVHGRQAFVYSGWLAVHCFVPSSSEQLLL